MNGCRIASRAEIREAILAPGVTVLEGAYVAPGAVIGAGATVEAAARRAIEGVEPRDGAGGNVAHRANLVAVYTRRALTRAAERARQ